MNRAIRNKFLHFLSWHGDRLREIASGEKGNASPAVRRALVPVCDALGGLWDRMMGEVA